MLKLFYKTFLVSILCGSLLLLDFGYKGQLLNSSQAETLKTDGVGGDNMMATLTMVGVGLLASRLYRYKMTTDIIVAAAGGVAFIAGDIIAVAKNKSVMKDLETEIKRDDKGKIDQKQIETLEKLRKSYEAAKSTANTKKMLQMASAAAFAAAGILAYTMTATEEAQQAQCLLALQNAGTTAYATDKAKCTLLHTQFAECTPTCTGPQAAVCLAGCTATFETPALACDAVTTACKAKVAADITAMKEYIITRETVQPSATGYSAMSASGSAVTATLGASAATCTAPYGSAELAMELSGACPGKIMVDNVDASFGTQSTLLALKKDPILRQILFPTKQLYVEAPPKHTMFEEAMRFFIPTARADLFSPLGIASSLAIKAILASNVALATELDLNLLIPKRRAIAWGILAGLAMAASMATGSEVQKIESNIQKIDAILNQMYSFQNGVAQTKTPSVQNGKIDKVLNPNKALNFNDANLEDVDLKANGKSMPCLTGDHAEKCSTFGENLKNSASFSSIPDTVQGQITSAMKLADGISNSSKISSATLQEAQALANRANALNAEFAKKQKEMQERLKASGSNQDLAKEGAQFEANLKSAIQKELDKNKMTPSQMLAEYGSGRGMFGSGGANVNSDALAKDSKAKDGKGKKGAAGFALPVVAVPAVTIPKLNDKSLSEGLKSEEDKSAELASAADGKTGDSIDDFDLKNDITKEKDTSIFDLISNRYQKSGYPRLFKRIK